MKILHVIVGLEIGGAELMLARLVRSMKHHQHVVVSLTTKGNLGLKLENEGYKVYNLNLTSFLMAPIAMLRFLIFIKKECPDIVQTWMYHADIFGGFVARLLGIKKIFWGVRNSKVPNSIFSITKLLILLASKLSWFLPHKIICCAEAAKLEHEVIGYSPQKMLVINNGYELEIYKQARKKRSFIRKNLGFSDQNIVIGIVARFDPLKDYKNFVDAALQVAKKNDSTIFLLIGRGVDIKNAELASWVSQSIHADRFKLMGERQDVPNLLAAMDIFCLSSMAEGFPNSVAEAMAARVPCVVTDVGDASLIVEKTGIVVPPKNSHALALGILYLASLSTKKRETLGQKARLIIEEKYSIEAISSNYDKVYQE